MHDLIRRFNMMDNARKSLIQKALTSATGVGEALIPQKLEQIITNTVVRLSPELAMIETEFDNQKYHEFNRITALPAAGGAMGEAAVTPTRNSTYERTGVNLKVIRRKGAVTNFLQDSSKKYIDAAAAEMENHLTQHVYDLCTSILWGNATANQYDFTGLDSTIMSNRVNEASAGTVPTSLSFLDNMIDANLVKQGANHRKAFLMSPYMISKISQLLTNVRLNQGLLPSGLTQVEVNGGWRLAAYRDIPIIPTMGLRNSSTMGTVTTSTGTSGGSLPASTTYYFRVSAVTQDGETMASAEVSQATGGTGSTHTITLSFSAVSGAYYYKVYMGTSTGAANTTLKRIVPAWAYDGVGTIGSAVTSIVITSATAGTEVPTAMQSDVPMVGSGGVPCETVILWDLDKYQGLGKFVYTNTAGSKFNGLVTMEPLARTDDDLPFLIKTYGALVPSWEGTSVMHRNLRIA